MSSPNLTSYLCCPRCLNPVDSDKEASKCSQCEMSWNLQEDMIDLRLDRSAYYCEFPKEDIQTFLKHAQEDLEEAIRHYLFTKQITPKLGEYMMGSARAGWKFLLPVNDQSRVLDLGCGWGTLSYSLAQSVKEVVAIDSTMERMELLRIRSRKEGQNNIKTVCAGDGKHLPFADNSFDMVIVNGVLEWVPSGMEGHPGELQLAFLKEIRRVLNPQGCLFLGIENRNAWKTWFRNADGHTDLKFVPWLPRWAANIYSKLKGKGPYRNWLYSRNQYKSLMIKAGFDCSEFFVPLPGYHHPMWMCRLTQPERIEKLTRRVKNSVTGNALQWVKGKLTASFPDAFSIIVKTNNTPPSYVESLLDHLSSKSDGGIQNFDPKSVDYRINGEMGMVTLLGGSNTNKNQWVIKLPLHKRASADLEYETQLYKKPPTALSLKIPSLISQGTFKGQAYTLHSFIQGASGEKFIHSNDVESTVLNEAVDFLVDLHAISKNSIKEDLLTDLIHRANSLVFTPEQRGAVENAGKRCEEYFHSMESQKACFGHGDFKLANLIFNPDSKRMTGLIDWGCWSETELPGYELTFLLTDLSWRMGQSLASNMKQWKDDIPSVDWANDAISRFSEKAQFPISKQTWQALMAWQWLKRLGPLADGVETKRFDYHYLGSMFDIYQ